MHRNEYTMEYHRVFVDLIELILAELLSLLRLRLGSKLTIMTIKLNVKKSWTNTKDFKNCTKM